MAASCIEWSICSVQDYVLKGGHVPILHQATLMLLVDDQWLSAVSSSGWRSMAVSCIEWSICSVQDYVLKGGHVPILHQATLMLLVDDQWLSAVSSSGWRSMAVSCIEWSICSVQDYVLKGGHVPILHQAILMLLVDDQWLSAVSSGRYIQLKMMYSKKDMHSFESRRSDNTPDSRQGRCVIVVSTKPDDVTWKVVLTRGLAPQLPRPRQYRRLCHASQGEDINTVDRVAHADEPLYVDDGAAWRQALLLGLDRSVHHAGPRTSTALRGIFNVNLYKRSWTLEERVLQ
ncbi:hypothetical protein J6590_068583 [Homalodisca vitripennis]|nr:hypothetical protein J6590_068583 [Homalodisca vitripennis]